MRRQFNATSLLSLPVCLAVFFSASHVSRADILIGGITFSDNAFADLVVDASPSGSGQFNKETSGGSQSLTLPADFGILQAAVVGSDIDEWISLRTSDAQLTLGFTDLIPVNGPGDDIAIVEIGQTAPVSITIEGMTIGYTSQPHGSVNLILIDLTDFGVSQAPAIMLSSNSILNDIAAAGAINSVPEPSSIVLAALGLIGLAAWGWRKR